MRLEAPTAVLLKSHVFWGVTMHCWVRSFWHFEGLTVLWNITICSPNDKSHILAHFNPNTVLFQEHNNISLYMLTESVCKYQSLCESQAFIHSFIHLFSFTYGCLHITIQLKFRPCKPYKQEMLNKWVLCIKQSKTLFASLYLQLLFSVLILYYSSYIIKRPEIHLLCTETIS